jgi:hypothetical protein
MSIAQKLTRLSWIGMALTCYLLVNGCRNDQEIKQLQKENARLKAEIEWLKTQQATQSPSPTPLPTPSPIQIDVAYEDTAGIFGEQEIDQLAQLGVFGSTIGKFNPQGTITRAEFVRWLVSANNAIWFDQPDKLVREAEGGEATFADVPPNHIDFPYIQGMANAGIAVGVDEKNFKPDQPITREEMMAIKYGLDVGGIDAPKESAMPKWSDRDKISKKLLPSFKAMYAGQNDIRNVERTYGAIKAFKPQAPVTRGEAAVCIAAIGDHSSQGKTIGNFRTVAEALQLKAKPLTP